MKGELKQIILNNSDLIYSIIHKLRGKDYEDLFQVGCIGLMKAYQNFEEKYGTKFTSYAYPYVWGEIYNHMLNNRTIHMSPGNMKLLSAMRKAEDKLTIHLGRSPNDLELASFLEIDLYKLSELRNMSCIDSLDNEDKNLYETISREDVSKDMLMDLKNALSSLTKEERSLIKKRYFNNLTQSELAKIYHTNQVKISRDEQKILNKLKKVMN